jgi:hypothetical protein
MSRDSCQLCREIRHWLLAEDIVTRDPLAGIVVDKPELNYPRFCFLLGCEGRGWLARGL